MSPGFVEVIVESQLVQVISFGSSNAKHDGIYANSFFIAAGVRQFFFPRGGTGFCSSLSSSVVLFLQKVFNFAIDPRGGVALPDLFGWDVVSGGS